MRKKITSIPALVEQVVIHLSEDAGEATGSSADTMLISVIQSVGYRALAKPFRSASIYLVVEEAVHKCVQEPASAGAVAAKLVYVRSFTVPAAKYVMHNF